MSERTWVSLGLIEDDPEPYIPTVRIDLIPAVEELRQTTKKLAAERRAGTLVAAPGKRCVDKTDTRKDQHMTGTTLARISETQAKFLRYLADATGTNWMKFDRPSKATAILSEGSGVDSEKIPRYIRAFEELDMLVVDRGGSGRASPRRIAMTPFGVEVANNPFIGLTAHEAIMKALDIWGPVRGREGGGPNGSMRGGVATRLSEAGVVHHNTALSSAIQDLAGEGSIEVRRHGKSIVEAWLPHQDPDAPSGIPEAGEPIVTVNDEPIPNESVDEAVEGMKQAGQWEEDPLAVALSGEDEDEEPVAEDTAHFEKLADALLLKVIRKATEEDTATKVFRERLAEMQAELEAGQAVLDRCTEEIAAKDRTIQDLGDRIETLQQELAKATQLLQKHQKRNGSIRLSALTEKDQRALEDLMKTLPAGR